MSSSRLYAVLRAGKARKGDEDEGGLTRALKRTSLVPTGACLPRTFDPDYCAYDRYYTLGVALVSTTIGAIINSSAPQRVTAAVAKGLRDVLGNYCHTPKPGWVWGDTWDWKQEHAKFGDWPLEVRARTKDEARADFSKLCTALDFSLAGIAEKAHVGGPFWDILGTDGTYDASWTPPEPGTRVLRNLALTLTKLLFLIFEPPFTIVDPAYRDFGRESIAFNATLLATWAAWTAASIKYLSRYMSEHALMVASFFRVNAKRLSANEPLMLDLQAFARQCKEDIADGPGPAVPPPPPGYTPYDPEAEAQRLRSAKVIDEVMKMPTIMAAYE